jgi:hypothetical protein
MIYIKLARAPNIFVLGHPVTVEYQISCKDPRSEDDFLYISWTIPKTVLPPINDAYTTDYSNEEARDDRNPIVMDQNAWALMGSRHQSMISLKPGQPISISWHLCPLTTGFVHLPPLLVTWSNHSNEHDASSSNFQHLYSPLEQVWVHPYSPRLSQSISIS